MRNLQYMYINNGSRLMRCALGERTRVFAVIRLRVESSHEQIYRLFFFKKKSAHH
jgi:hypothetical protein